MAHRLTIEARHINTKWREDTQIAALLRIKTSSHLRWRYPRRVPILQPPKRIHRPMMDILQRRFERPWKYLKIAACKNVTSSWIISAFSRALHRSKKKKWKMNKQERWKKCGAIQSNKGVEGWVISSCKLCAGRLQSEPISRDEMNKKKQLKNTRISTAMRVMQERKSNTCFWVWVARVAAVGRCVPPSAVRSEHESYEPQILTQYAVDVADLMMSHPLTHWKRYSSRKLGTGRGKQCLYSMNEWPQHRA